jgi:hypothetical protein
MFKAYDVMRGLHDLMLLLYTASVHVADARLTAQLHTIERICEHTPVDQIDSAALKRSTMALLADPAIRAGLQRLR